jgi:hypothetical protein
VASKIKADTLQVLADWKAGKPVKSVELGHVHSMKEVPGFSPTIDASKHLYQDQERAHAYCFYIVERAQLLGQPPEEHDTFLQWCDGWQKDFHKDHEALTAEESDGAESLAWKALRFGWARAIEGHKDSLYIEVTNPAVEAKPRR